jgi:hypothetical protein
VVSQATTFELQQRCVDALVWKSEILWHLLDTTYAAYVEPAWRVGVTPVHGIGPRSAPEGSAIGPAGSGGAP